MTQAIPKKRGRPAKKVEIPVNNNKPITTDKFRNDLKELIDNSVQKVKQEEEVKSEEPNYHSYFPLPETEEPLPEPPQHWQKGALLNVRNYGDQYIITLYPEEFDYRHPEKALTFTNPGRCQDFVSKWYAREAADPRAR